MCFLGYNSFGNSNETFVFLDAYMLQSFVNDAGLILEISVISNRRDKNASVIYSGSSPGQTSTDRGSVIQFTD